MSFHDCVSAVAAPCSLSRGGKRDRTKVSHRAHSLRWLSLVTFAARCAVVALQSTIAITSSSSVIADTSFGVQSFRVDGTSLSIVLTVPDAARVLRRGTQYQYVSVSFFLLALESSCRCSVAIDAFPVYIFWDSCDSIISSSASGATRQGLCGRQVSFSTAWRSACSCSSPSSCRRGHGAADRAPTSPADLQGHALVADGEMSFSRPRRVLIRFLVSVHTFSMAPWKPPRGLGHPAASC